MTNPSAGSSPTMRAWLDRIWNKVIDPLVDLLILVVKELWDQHKVRVGVLAGMLVTSVVLANFYIQRTKQYQSIISSTIHSAGEDTPQRYKVLEAFTLSSLDSMLQEQV